MGTNARGCPVTNGVLWRTVWSNDLFSNKYNEPVPPFLGYHPYVFPLRNRVTCPQYLSLTRSLNMECFLDSDYNNLSPSSGLRFRAQNNHQPLPNHYILGGGGGHFPVHFMAQSGTVGIRKVRPTLWNHYVVLFKWPTVRYPLSLSRADLMYIRVSTSKAHWCAILTPCT
jgi:hypothetical protein